MDNTENFSLQELILARNKTHGLDSAFTDYDFSDLASPEILQATLYEMEQTGKLIQAFEGESVFVMPEAIEKLPRTIIALRCVEALSRKFLWKAVPSGKFALISSGLEKEGSELTAEFITSAPDTVYNAKNFNVVFHHTDFPVQGSLSIQSEYILQVFTALGHEKVNASALEHLKKMFTESALRKAAVEIKGAPGTSFQVKEFIKKSVYGRA